jgi:diguanylate cyclase (GGDEF)-like protein
VLARRWNASHGGVYVPVTEPTRPNPYLDDPRRDIPVAPDLTLTKVNPAFMTRQLSELANQGTGVQFRITSLDPIRPENAPHGWEAAALRRFEQGAEEVGERLAGDGTAGYRYMAPLFTERPCLTCHETARLGEVRGGISVTLPRLAEVPWRPLVASHVLVALAGAVLIIGAARLLLRAQSRLRRQALFDALTAIPNRRFFIEHLMSELRPERMPLSLLICDIDFFKDFNDSLGHQRGDECLQAVARVLRGVIRRSGDFCARYGGEEFVVILPSTGLRSALAIGEIIRQAVTGLQVVHPGSPFGVVTISIGVAVDDSGSLDDQALIRRADQALYRAKAEGRNRVQAWCCAARAEDAALAGGDLCLARHGG